MKKIYRSDLHVHSCYSNKPSIWALRKINCPESYTSPSLIYQAAKKMGMDYVTITDHNTIQGALEIRHLPDTFLSTEVTTYFPEDGCKVHVVVLDITEEVFGDIMILRKNIYELVAYLQENDIVHFIAHPLYDNDKLTAETVEKMVLLFEVFEVKNGSRTKRFNVLIERILSSLTPEKMEFLSQKHTILPYGKEPWKKSMTGGSDDHGGLFIGRAYTASVDGESVKEFIRSIKVGKTWAEGEDGDPRTLAHSIYGVGYNFIKKKFTSKNGNSLPFVTNLLNNMFDCSPQKLSLFEKIKIFVIKNLPAEQEGYDDKNFDEILESEAKKLLSDKKFLTDIQSETMNGKIFAVTSFLANRLIYIYVDKLTRMSQSIGLMSYINSLSSIGIVQLFMLPYYVSFHQQNRGKFLVSELEEKFCLPDETRKKQKIALFTDTLHEINGVAITIKRFIESAKNQGLEFVVITSTSEETGLKNGVMNFKAIGDCNLPEYPELKLHFPPILNVIDYFEKEGFTQIHVSTPGTLGLTALFISKLMNTPISGTYHTDIPQYVKSLTNDEFLENAAWSYMLWFYNQMKEVMVPSASTQRQLIEKGLAVEKVKPFPRWVDTKSFSPSQRNSLLWSMYGLNSGIKFLYVGRVSKEKNLKLLAEAFIDIVKTGFSCNLIIVGDGPYRKELELLLNGYPVLFMGFLSGGELSRVYASSDVFVFPSTTDTFGNVVLEAQASGLPVIVSDEGGPRELIRNGKTGVIVKAHDKEALIHAMVSFLKDVGKCSSMGREARIFTETNDIQPCEEYHTIFHSRAVNEKQWETDELSCRRYQTSKAS
ncbi:MAG: glycosyltransferase [Candidatus Brocadiaceae bacterium]|nr:glycosyltransferase [Candidatus Brocadiaceae bacterium]